MDREARREGRRKVKKPRVQRGNSEYVEKVPDVKRPRRIQQRESKKRSVSKKKQVPKPRARKTQKQEQRKRGLLRNLFFRFSEKNSSKLLSKITKQADKIESNLEEVILSQKDIKKVMNQLNIQYSPESSWQDKLDVASRLLEVAREEAECKRYKDDISKVIGDLKAKRDEWNKYNIIINEARKRGYTSWLEIPEDEKEEIRNISV